MLGRDFDLLARELEHDTAVDYEPAHLCVTLQRLAFCAVRQLQTGLWHWTAPHPDWQPSEPWDQAVSSYAIDEDDRLLLFDPLAVPSEIEELAAERELVVVLTNPWHPRARALLSSAFRASSQ